MRRCWAIGCSGVWCTLGLLSYFSHQHSEVLLAAILPFEAEDGTRQYPKPLVMTLSASDVQATIIIRCCPRNKLLRLCIHVPSREDTCPKPCVFSLTETRHTSVVGNPEEDDQLKQWNRHIAPPTEQSRHNPGVLRRDIVHQELCTLRPFALVGEGWVSRQPEVIVCIKMGTLQTRG